MKARTKHYAVTTLQVSSLFALFVAFVQWIVRGDAGLLLGAQLGALGATVFLVGYVWETWSDHWSDHVTDSGVYIACMSVPVASVYGAVWFWLVPAGFVVVAIGLICHWQFAPRTETY